MSFWPIGLSRKVKPLKEALVFVCDDFSASLASLFWLPVPYLIRVAPPAFAPHRQNRSRESPSLLVVLPGSQHFTVTPEIPFTSPSLEPCSIPGNSTPWESRFHQGLTGPATSALGPILGDTTRALRITAAAGTHITQLLFANLSKVGKSPFVRGTRIPSVTLSRIAEFSRLLHPVGLGSLSQYPSPGSLSQGPYGSSAWWAVTPPTT